MISLLGFFRSHINISLSSDLRIQGYSRVSSSNCWKKIKTWKCVWYPCLDVVKVLLAEMESNSASEAPLIAMEELARINPSVLVPKIASLAAQKMEDRTLMVSFNDYQTYLTKEGELFDKSLTESFRKDGSDSTNIKRENKAYSYKEQVRMWMKRKWVVTDIFLSIDGVSMLHFFLLTDGGAWASERDRGQEEARRKMGRTKTHSQTERGTCRYVFYKGFL